MPIGLLKDIAGQIPKEGRLLGMDVGEKTIGFAVCAPADGIATPLGTLKRTKLKQDAGYIAKLVKEYEVTGFVIGYPLNMDGTEGRQCQSIRNFAEELAKYPDVVGKTPWIAFWDERLSTAVVEDFVDNVVDIKRSAAKDRGITDKLAAQYILQGALEYLHKKLK